jgi:hypothetical protein
MTCATTNIAPIWSARARFGKPPSHPLTMLTVLTQTPPFVVGNRAAFKSGRDHDLVAWEPSLRFLHARPLPSHAAAGRNFCPPAAFVERPGTRGYLGTHALLGGAGENGHAPPSDRQCV